MVTEMWGTLGRISRSARRPHWTRPQSQQSTSMPPPVAPSRRRRGGSDGQEEAQVRRGPPPAQRRRSPDGATRLGALVLVHALRTRAQERSGALPAAGGSGAWWTSLVGGFVRRRGLGTKRASRRGGDVDSRRPSRDLPPNRGHCN